MENNSLMDNDDRVVYENNLTRREDLLGVLFKDGTPDDHRSMRLAKELMESSDVAILKKTELKLKSKSLESANEIQSTIVELVRENARQRAKGKRDQTVSLTLDADVAEDYTPVPGQLDAGHRKLQLTDVIENGTPVVDDEIDE